jgi:prophage regulatory protein
MPKQAVSSPMLRAPQVIELVGLSRTSIMRLAHEGRFPAPIKISPRAIGWLLSDIEAYLASRPKALSRPVTPEEPLYVTESDLGPYRLHPSQLKSLHRGEVVYVRRLRESQFTMIKLKEATDSDRRGG